MQFFRRKGFPQGFCQGVPPGLIGHPLPGQMAGEVAAGDEPRQCLLLKTAHRAGVEGVFRTPCGQKLLRQHHVGDADAGREAAGAGGEVDHRPVGPRHPLQAGQGPGVETELRIVVVLDDVPLSGTPCRPVEQFCPASGGHGDARGELVAGGDIAHRRPRLRQRPDGQPVLVHRQTTAGDAVVFQHLPGAGVAGIFHCRRPGQERGQQTQQIFETRAHDELVRAAPHTAVLLKVLGQRLPQREVALGVTVGQQLRRRVQQLFLQPRPCAERKQLRVYAPGGEVVADGLLRRWCCLGLGRRGGLCPLGQGQIFLYIKAAALPRLQIALRRQHLIGRVHRVHRDGKLCRQPPLAGHPGPGRNRPRPHLGSEAAVELFVERHTGRRVQCCRQMDHKKPLLFGQCAKLDP